ncbi:family 20 glycosylhydrolase [Nonomuraea montanisoli]|uniref:family 20 glycosylhydrolase n=1 Tax=Nonomuraea montanisoli TaxID=2741721 RepID=UPI001F3E81F4|nr:family 20 glycosylhydrolase [Nonomuraea montanisoli]
MNTATAVAAPGDPPRIVPVPASLTITAGTSFSLTQSTAIVGSGFVAEYLAGVLRRSTGFPFPITTSGSGITLSLSGPATMAQEAYRLDVTAQGVTITARTQEGLLRGVQTFRQLLPPKVESPTVQAGPWTIDGVSITDQPRFAWRGVMLDVARHFFTVDEVKRFIDQAALYKVNVLHLHLADDQGWRIQIDSWPRLATYGGSTEVGGGPGGHYTKQDYAEITRYAADRFMTVVPEIDMPGHTNAALASYAELNCDGQAPPLRTDTAVGYSSLCISKEITYRFVDDVIRELAAMTPGPYLHIGGDEAHNTAKPDYMAFVKRVGETVAAHGKKLVGWQEIGQATLPTDATGQYWGSATHANSVVAQGGKLVFSPPGNAYLDMKYNQNTPLGLDWAGYIEVQKAYGWDPATVIGGVSESSIRGVEAPLWTETIANIEDAEFMTNPRLAAIAEIGWSPASTHDWQSFSTRLGAQGPRWSIRKTNYYRSTQVPWPAMTGRITGVGSAKCVDVPAFNSQDGTDLILYTCNGGANQSWTYDPANGEIRSLGKCMDVEYANPGDGTAVQLYTCNGTTAQKWTYDSATRNLTALGKCLTADGAGTTNFTELVISTCHGAPDQQWALP